MLVRQIRADLKAYAEKAGIDIFSKNLKQLLLTKPLKGRPILAIDPGYQNGCKCAVISNTGLFLASDIIYPHLVHKRSTYEKVLKDMLISNK